MTMPEAELTATQVPEMPTAKRHDKEKRLRQVGSVEWRAKKSGFLFCQM